MTPEEATSLATNTLAKALANLLELSAPIQEAALGYRQRLLDENIDPINADTMMVHFHNLATQVIINGLEDEWIKKREQRKKGWR